MKQILTIAGSDSGGGAGIQADIKTISANGGYGLSVVVAVTAQNTKAVTRAYPLPLDIIRAQIDAIFDDFDVAAVKTGMLASREIVELVADALGTYGAPNLVVDPVMISKGGCRLLQDDAVEAVRARLLPLARVVTPNVHEAELLTGLSIRTVEDAKEAAERIVAAGCRAAVVTGGHLDGGGHVVDIVYDGSIRCQFGVERYETRNTHGTGCTYSAALATFLAEGRSLVEAASEAQDYVVGAIEHAPDIGHGHGPTGHFWRFRCSR